MAKPETRTLEDQQRERIRLLETKLDRLTKAGPAGIQLCQIADIFAGIPGWDWAFIQQMETGEDYPTTPMAGNSGTKNQAWRRVTEFRVFARRAKDGKLVDRNAPTLKGALEALFAGFEMTMPADLAAALK